jgi:hypothetical protein
MSFGLGFWAAAGATSAPAYELISTTILGSDTASVSFDVTGLGSTYRHIQVRASSNTTDTTFGNTNLNARFNSDTGSNYAFHILFGDITGVASAAATTQTFVAFGDMVATASVFGGAVIDVLDFANTSKNKTIRSLSGTTPNPSLTRIALRSGLWMNTSAITGINLFPGVGNLKTGTRLSLYGIRG